VRAYLEGGAEPGFYLIAGDSAYPISPVLVKPYNNREELNNALNKLFNQRLSAIRTIMSENVFAMWKRRFPILRMMRAHFHAARIIIIATAILHNIGIRMGEAEVLDDDDVLNFLRVVIEEMDEAEAEAARPGEAAEIAAEDAAVAVAQEDGVAPINDPVRRVQGQLRRDQLRDGMPPRGRGRRRRL
jgi:hypothetical protein